MIYIKTPDGKEYEASLNGCVLFFVNKVTKKIETAIVKHPEQTT